MLVQSCATLHCNDLESEEKQACIESANASSLWHTTIHGNHGATDAGNAAATHIMMTPPPMMP